MTAFHRLGLLGTLEDLEFLRPFCDFWNRGDEGIDRPCSAMRQIRARYGYDLSGPIRKVARLPVQP